MSSDYALVVALKKCDPELSFTLVDLFNICQKESCVIPVFKNIGEKFLTKICC